MGKPDARQVIALPVAESIEKCPLFSVFPHAGDRNGIFRLSCFHLYLFQLILIFFEQIRSHDTGNPLFIFRAFDIIPFRKRNLKLLLF